MQLSDARIESNRKNSLKSTGPRSPSGRLRSRLNAFKHGLCAEVLVADDELQALRDRAGAVDPTPLPADGLDDWAAGQVGLLSLRIERCQESEQAIRERIVSRAGVTWDEDRKLEATLLGATLGKRPDAVAARLRETYHGCEWLIGRWTLLAHAAMTRGGWSPDQTNVAFDLLGTPIEFREGTFPGAMLDPQGKLTNRSDDDLAVARRQIADLERRRELLRPIEEAARRRAEADLAADTDPELKKLRRYETSLQRRLEWSLDLLQELAPIPQSPTAPEPTPEPEGEPTAPPVANPAPELVVPTPSVEISSTMASLSRVEKRLMKAETRRDARRRKLEARRS